LDEDERNEEECGVRSIINLWTHVFPLRVNNLQQGVWPTLERRQLKERNHRPDDVIEVIKRHFPFRNVLLAILICEGTMAISLVFNFSICAITKLSLKDLDAEDSKYNQEEDINKGDIKERRNCTKK
jgi:hypothetical protein